jgi:RNA polymerase sigma-70 factor (ECF subfamily)
MGIASHAVDDPVRGVMMPPSEVADLYERHYADVYRAALRVTGNPADAEDVLQTVFMRMLHQESRLDPARAPGGYLRRAAVNAAVDLLRRRVAQRESDIGDFPALAASSGPALLKERLRRAIATLEQRDAEVFLLRYVEGFSNGELASLLGLRKNAVAVRLHRIRHALQEQMRR